MPKLNYIRALLDSLEEEKVKSIAEEYAKKNKAFEAFIIEHSGKVVDSGKNYQDYQQELAKVLKKCTSRKGFVKVKRLMNAGVGNFQKLLNSHFKNANFRSALWMSLALMETMHQAILMNTRYPWANKPYKSFEKLLGESRDQFDTSYRFAKVQRKDRQQIFDTLVRCWWAERQRDFPRRYFDGDDFFRYTARDEDLIAIQKCLNGLKPEARKTPSIRVSSWKDVWSGIFPGSGSLKNTSSTFYEMDLQQLEERVKEELDKWD